MADKNEDGSYSLRKIFEQIELDLVKSMKRNLAKHEAEEEARGFKWEQWQKAKLRNLKEYRTRNKLIVDEQKPKIEKLINDTMQDEYRRGEGFFDRLIKKLGTKLMRSKKLELPKDISESKIKYETKEKSFFGMNDRKLEALQKSVNHDIEKAESAVLRRMEDVYKQTIYKAEIHMSSGAKTLSQAVDLATKEFLDKGINCIEYKNGRRVNIATYTEMALRTASHRATLLGEGKKRDEWGVHTVVVSSHANTCGKCATWQAKVLVDNVFSHGTKEEAEELGYPLLSEAVDTGLLHPNCRHTIVTFFHGVTILPEMQDIEEATKKYDAEQEQRAIEREIRKWKRVKEGSLDDENIKFADTEIKKFQAKMKEHLEKHPYLRRDLSREKTRGISNKLINADKMLEFKEKHIDDSGRSGIIESDNANDKGVDILIDKYTPCLIKRSTGEVFKTEMKPITLKDSLKLKSKGWKFDWSIPHKQGFNVYKLNLQGDNKIQGMISFSKDKSTNGVYVDLVESAPHNFGSSGEYDGVGAHLFAFACKTAQDSGFDCVYFYTKNTLASYYNKKLGAQLIGNSQKMYIDGDAFNNLIKKYYSKE